MGEQKVCRNPECGKIFRRGVGNVTYRGEHYCCIKCAAIVNGWTWYLEQNKKLTNKS